MKRKAFIPCLVALTLPLLYLGLYQASVTFARVDYERVLQGKRPVFSYRKAPELMDGGTVQYQGLGYLVFNMHKFTDPDHYEVGPWIHYQLRWLFPASLDRRSDRKETKIVKR